MKTLIASLLFYWRTQLAVVAGVAVSTAVIAGALVVGDSVRQSLSDLSLARLGSIDFALLTHASFQASLAERLAAAPSFLKSDRLAVASVLVQGSAVASKTSRRASRVNVTGIDASFLELFDVPERDFWNSEPKRRVVLNQRLRDELQVVAGDEIVLHLPRYSEAPRGVLMADRSPDSVLRSLRLTVVDAGESGPGRFALRPQQAEPLNAFVPLAVLQRALGLEDEANALFVASHKPDLSAVQRLQASLGEVLGLEDYGVRVTRDGELLILESRELVLKPEIETAVRAAALALSLSYQPVITYLANKTSVAGRTIPYSTISAVDGKTQTSRFALLRDDDGSVLGGLAEDELAMSRWAADDLGAKLGDSVEIEYFDVLDSGELRREKTELRLAAIVSNKGLAADRRLSPRVAGVHDALNMSDWDPPFPVELNRIRPQDEDYWDRHGATPKLFVSETTGRRLWSSRYGSLTSMRFFAGAETADIELRLRTELLRHLPLGVGGFQFEPVKHQSLAAARSGTDFGGLFLGFSFFLIVSSTLIVGLLFTLGVERRARELGLRLALGFPLGQVRASFLIEAAVLALWLVSCWVSWAPLVMRLS